MRAYELAVVFCISPSKVWRRVVVPEELTFSQLAFVFNVAMGQDEKTSFSFLLEHKKILITELHIDQLPHEKLLDASKTQIYQYLEQAGSFVYVYENRNEMRFDVQLEKVIDKWPQKAPQVLSGEGVCSAVSLPETTASESARASDYDYGIINDKLSLWCCITRRRYERRTLQEICEDIKAGKYGFFAYKKNNNLADKPVASPKERKAFFEDFLRTGIQQAKNKERVLPSLQEMLAEFSKDEILSIAEQKGMDVRHGMKKQDIIMRLTKEMLKPCVMKNYFLCLHDEEVLSLQHLLADPDTFEERAINSLETLATASYIAETPSLDIVIARDVAEGFITFVAETEEDFTMLRHCRTWLIDTILAANNLYSVTPLEILSRIYNQGGLGTLTPAEVKKEMAKIPPELLEGYWHRGDVFIAEGLGEEEIQMIVEAQGDGGYYIPATKDIPLLAQGLLLSNQEDKEALANFFCKTLSYDKEETAEIMQHIHWSFLAGAPVSFVRDMLKNEGYFDDLKKEQDILLRRLLNRVHDNTRSVINRGFTANEIKEQRQKARADKQARKKAAREKVVFLKDRSKEKLH